ncbi:MAG: flagellar basal body rod protein FlgB [Ignavibacteria bacterium]
MGLFDATKIPLLSKALDAYALRQKVSASNIANITTAGYKSQRVSFEEQLADAQAGMHVRGAQTNAKHLPVGSPHGIEQIRPEVHNVADDPPPGYNEMASGFNDVDIDVEMAEMVKNQIRYKFSARMLGDTIKGIQKAIRGTL